jgi:ABC-type polysaccharide/polyol phosphate export permease
MSLGVLWSLLNPLVMMGVLTFVWTKIFQDPRPHFAFFVLCGLIPYNFFTLAWSGGTTSVVDNAGLIKRIPVPREVVPITTVLACCTHLVVQLALLMAFAIGSGVGINRQWIWLPVLWGLEIVFVSGLSLVTSSANVFLRDTRYIVESANLVLLWLVPVFYDLSIVPLKYREVYMWNPLAALIVALRRILVEAQPPDGPTHTMWKLAAVAFFALGVGLVVFRRMKSMFYEHI